jgi:hypothetical protein
MYVFLPYFSVKEPNRSMIATVVIMIYAQSPGLVFTGSVEVRVDQGLLEMGLWVQGLPTPRQNPVQNLELLGALIQLFV